MDPLLLVTEGGPSLNGPGHPLGSVRWLERSPLGLSLETEAPRPTVLAVSQAWYPGWEARVNGAPVPVLRAWGALQAVALPAGKHRVELHLRSRRLGMGLGLAVLGLACFTGLFAWRRSPWA
jgi:hypothetical protein